MAFSKEFVRNWAGLLIVRCCASCKYHMSDPQRERICQCSLHHKRRRIDDVCGDHAITDVVPLGVSVSLASLRPKPSGKIKKPEYINFMQSQLAKINGDSMSQNDFADMISNLRTTWEKLHGSRYIENF